MKPHIHRMNTPLLISPDEISKTRADVQNKLKSKKINISKTTDDEVDVLKEFVKMTLNQVVAQAELFSRKATKEALAKGRDAAAAICPLCQESYSKKNKLTQCEFCAKSCCTQCCYKSRLDPQAKNAETAEKCLICQDCEDKYLNVQLNRTFRKQYAGLSKLMDELQGQLTKIQTETKLQKDRAQQAKPKEDQQVALSRTLKLAKFKKQIQTNQKDIEKIHKDTTAERQKTPNLEHKLVQRQMQIEEAIKKKELLRVEEERRKKERQQAEKRKAEEKERQQIQAEEQRKKKEELDRLLQQENARKKLDLDHQAKKVPPIPLMPTAPHTINATDEFEVLAAEKIADKPSDNEETLTAQKDLLQKQKETGDVPPLPYVSPESAQVPTFGVSDIYTESIPRKEDQIEEGAKSAKSSVLQKSQEHKPTSKPYDPWEDQKIGTNPKSSSQRNSNEANASSANPGKLTVSEKGELVSSNKNNEHLQLPEEKEDGRASRTHSQYSPSKQQHESKADKPRPVSNIYELESDGRPTEQEDQMLSRSMIVEPDNKQEAARRKPSKNMTETEILKLRIRPPKNQKLFRQSSDKNRVNVSIKETSSTSMITPENKSPVYLSLIQPLSKEEILRKSRNEDLDESQTPNVDEKSKCSCSIF